ncbi:MAG: M28 family peptidase [Candidatus Omnitrophota bacterium]|jgi:Zn-dependent M28 family amino/carboxypeptidase
MMKRLLIALIIFLPNVVFAQQADELKKHVEYLASPELDGRQVGTAGCDKAAEYIIQQLKVFGYTPEEQPFTMQRVTAKNVIAVRKGSLDTVIVVGAHYDHLGRRGNRYYPGADDNASGTAAVLELSRMLKTSRRTIVFILFSGEEDGLYGSTYYVKHPKYPNDKTIFMLNLDMIGYLRRDTQAYVPDVHKILKELYIQYPWAPSIVILGGTASDQEPFADIGIPVAFLHTGLHGNYHRTTDTPDKLNYKGMEQIVRFSYDLIKALDTHDLPDYNITGVKYEPVK